MNVIGIIPARLASSRLPGKLLLSETGKPLLQHTWEAASRSALLDLLVIAADDEQIASAARQFGAEVVMTGECDNGTERVAEAVEKLGETSSTAEIIVNIQGDEPEIDPDQIDVCVQGLHEHDECEMATLANPILEASMVEDPSCVKVVLASNGQALYFSRSVLPFSRDCSPAERLEDPQPYQTTPWLQHIGLYAYRRDFLRAFVAMPASPLEIIEKLEQLRALQAGAQIHVSVVPHCANGIDTPEDYAAFVERMA